MLVRAVTKDCNRYYYLIDDKVVCFVAKEGDEWVLRKDGDVVDRNADRLKLVRLVDTIVYEVGQRFGLPEGWEVVDESSVCFLLCFRLGFWSKAKVYASPKGQLYACIDNQTYCREFPVEWDHYGNPSNVAIMLAEVDTLLDAILRGKQKESTHD